MKKHIAFVILEIQNAVVCCPFCLGQRVPILSGVMDMLVMKCRCDLLNKVSCLIAYWASLVGLRRYEMGYVVDSKYLTCKSRAHWLVQCHPFITCRVFDDSCILQVDTHSYGLPQVDAHSLFSCACPC